MDESWPTTGIRTGLSITRHPPEAEDYASLRMFTFDRDGKPTITYLGLSRDEVVHLRDALAEMLPSMTNTRAQEAE